MCLCRATYDPARVSSATAHDSAAFATGQWMNRYGSVASGLSCGSNDLLLYEGQGVPLRMKNTSLDAMRKTVETRFDETTAYLTQLRLFPELDAFRKTEIRSIELAKAMALAELDYWRTRDQAVLSKIQGQPVPPRCLEYAKLAQISDPRKRLAAWEKLASKDCADAGQRGAMSPETCRHNLKIEKQRIEEDASALCSMVQVAWHNCVNDRFRGQETESYAERVKLLKKHWQSDQCKCQGGD
jgi:hypothetical protein